MTDKIDQIASQPESCPKSKELGGFYTGSYKILFITILCLLSFQSNLAQIVISGKIVDENNEPLPSVHVRVENTNIGSISNDFGLFKLIVDTDNKTASVVISAIGFSTKKVSLREGHHTLSLDPYVTELKEVTLFSRDYGKELIKNAINAIPNNYPKKEERHKGFFRETTSWEEGKKPIYVAEAVIEAVKKPYAKQHRSGEVKLVEFRKYESNQLDSLGTRIYAGSHHIHRFDIVSRREAFLGNPDAYSYKVKDTLRQNDKDIYQIYVEKKNKMSGHVYVMDSSFAIIKADFKYRSFFELPINNRQFLNYTVTYERGEDKAWRFKHSHYETAFKRKGRLFNLTSEYVTTEVQNNKSNIPYSEKLQFGDILLDKSKAYKPKFWDNYNIILPNNESESLFESIDYSKKNIHKSESHDLIAILRRFKYTLAFVWTSIDVDLHTLTYNHPILDIQQDGVASRKYSWGLASSLLYSVKPNLFIGYANESKISKTGATSHDLVISGNFNINPNGRPIFISPGINLGYQKLDYFIEKYSVEEDLKIKGKSFDSNGIDVFLSQRNFRIKPNLSLVLEKSRKLSFLISTGYNFQLNKREGVLFQEKDGFLFRKKTFVENGHDNLLIEGDNRDLLKNTITISAGVSFKFL